MGLHGWFLWSVVDLLSVQWILIHLDSGESKGPAPPVRLLPGNKALLSKGLLTIIVP